MKKKVFLCLLASVLFSIANAQNIDFADNDVKALCVTNWDTNGDGELSVAEAADVTTLGQVFKGNSNITSFDELQYFTGLTSIGESTFYNCSNLTSVTIPESVTSIGDDAFNGCSLLASINIPSSVNSIGARVFSGCNSMSSVQITDLTAWCNISFNSNASNPLNYGHHLFLNGEEITDLVIPNGISLLKSHTFAGGYFSSVTIPSSCLFTNSKCVFAFSHIGSITINQYLAEETFIQEQIGNLMIAPEVTGAGSHAFYDTKIDNLEIPYSSGTLKYSYGGNSYALFDGCTINKATVNRQISSSYSGSNTMPPFYYSTIKEMNVGSNTWYTGDNLCGRVTIDDLYFDGITDISANAFYSTSSGNNNIHNIHLSSGISNIGSYAFYSCGSLNSVIAEMPSPPIIESNTFNSKFTRSSATLYVPAGSKTAYEDAQYWQDFGTIVEMAPPSPVISFADSNVKDICIANWDTNGDGELSVAEAADVTTLGQVFKGNSNITSFDELQYFTGLTEIGNEAFAKSTIQSVIIPENVTAITDGAFDQCAELTHIELGSKVTTIGYIAFRGCNKLPSIVFPDNLTEIGQSSFESCYNLNNVRIGAKVSDIKIIPFRYCYNLTSLVVDENNPYFDSRGDCNAIIQTENNKLIVGCSVSTIPDDVTTIGIYSFEGSNLNSIYIPGNVTRIEERAFNDCVDLSSVTVCWETPVSITRNTFSKRYSGTLKPTLYVPAGSKSAYETAAYWQDFKIEELSSATNDENVIAEKDWSSPYWFGDYEDIGATYEMTADGVAINNPQVQENYWTPQTLVLDNATLEEDHSYKVVVNAKIPSDGQLQINMGSWGFAQQYDISVMGSDEFQDIEVLFEDFPSNEEGVHVLFQNGGIAGTCVVRNVKIIEITDDENVIAEKDWTSPYWFESFEGIDATYEMTADGVAINNPQVQENYWTPQTLVLDGATLEVNHSYKVVINAKIPSDGQLQVNMGNWGFAQQYDFPVTASDEFQDIEVVFDEYPESIEDVHILFQNGGIAGTSVVRNVKIIDLGDIPADLMYDYNTDNKTATVIKNPDRKYKEAVVIPPTVTHEGEEYTVTAIEVDAFTDCTMLTSISIPATVTSLSGYSFANCASLQQIVVDPSNTVYDSRSDCNAIIETATNHLIAGCHQTVIPDDVTEIGNNAFWGRWGMETMNIPESVTSIGAYAFAYSISLNKIIIPAGVESIGEGAFAECNALTAVHVGNPVPVEIEENTFSNRSNATLYVPSGSVAAYKEAAYWQEFKEIVPMVNIIVNSDLEDSDYSSFSNELQDGAGLIQDGVGSNDSRGLVIQSVDNPTDPWDTQLWINLPCGLPAGTKYHLSFDYKASQDATGSMIFQEGLGGDIADYFTNVDFTTDWRHFDLCGTYDSESLGEDLGDRLARYICLHLSQFETATTFYLDNIVFEIKPFAYAAEAPWGRDLKNTGEAQELVEGGLAINGTFQYSLDGENYSEEIPTATKTSWYTVYYKVVSDNPEVDDSKPAEIGLFIKSRFEELDNLIQQAQVVGVNTEEAEAVNNDEASYDQVEEALASLRADYISKLAEGIDSDLLPLDVTNVIDNPRYIMDLPNGWITDENEEFGIGWACASIENVFNTRQTITGLPNGTYKLKVKGFHRPGNQNDVTLTICRGPIMPRLGSLPTKKV